MSVRPTRVASAEEKTAIRLADVHKLPSSGGPDRLFEQAPGRFMRVMTKEILMTVLWEGRLENGEPLKIDKGPADFATSNA